MTLTTENNKTEHTANGSTVDFTYDFLIFSEDDLKVYLDGVLQTSGYSVSGVGLAAGGEVTFYAATPANGVIVSLYREVELTQEVDYNPYGPFPAETHESALDKLTMLVQQVYERTIRAITAPIGVDPTIDFTLPDYEAGKALVWDSPTKQLRNSVDDFDGAASAAAASAVAAQAASSAAGSAAFTASSAAGTAVTMAARAEDLAQKAEDSEIDPGLYSAYHWAQKSEEFSDRTNIADTWVKNQKFAHTQAIPSGTYTLDFLNAPSCQLSLALGDLTLGVSNLAWGLGVELIIDQGATTARDLLFSSSFKLSKYDLSVCQTLGSRTIYWLWTDGSYVYIRKVWESN